MIRRALLLVAAAAVTHALSAVPTKKLIAVTGSTGKLGRRAVEAVVQSGHRVRALVRHDPASSASDGATATGPEVTAWLSTLGDDVELVKGDVTNATSVAALVEGADACLSLHGAVRRAKISDLWRDPTVDADHARNVNYKAVAGLIGACEAAGSVLQP